MAPPALLRVAVGVPQSQAVERPGPSRPRVLWRVELRAVEAQQPAVPASAAAGPHPRCRAWRVRLLLA